MTSYDNLRSGAAWIDLSNRGKIRVTGEDRVRLLHAMCTNDIQNLAPGNGVYAFFLTAQGRIIADANVYNFGESLVLDTEPELAGKLIEHLDKYIIVDDVVLTDETALWYAIGIEGPRSREKGAEVASALGTSLPSAPLGVNPWDGGFVAQSAVTGGDGFRFFVRSEEKTVLRGNLEKFDIPAADDQDVRTVRLENGFPRYGDDINDRYLVHETQQLRGVHFNKGCYVGQEIVERVRSRGQVHRLLTPLRIGGTEPPVPGTKLNANEKEVGEITSAAFSPALGEVVALAYLRDEALAGQAALSLAGNESVRVAAK